MKCIIIKIMPINLFDYGNFVCAVITTRSIAGAAGCPSSVNEYNEYYVRAD